MECDELAELILRPRRNYRLLARVRAAFRADAERDAFDRDADARPPIFPPLRYGDRFSGLPRPDPLFSPPP